MACAFFGAVKSWPAQVKALLGDINLCSQVIFLVNLA